MTNIFIICGAPGSGKTTYVKSIMTEKDIVWDMDYIRRALCLRDDVGHDLPPLTFNAAMSLRIGFMAYVKKYWVRYSHVYIITSASPKKAQQIADEFGGTLVVMQTSLDECVKNIMKDPTRKDTGKQVDLAKAWYSKA